MTNNIYSVAFAPAARRRLARLTLAAATALSSTSSARVAGNPHRLGKSLDPPYDDVWTTRRGDYRALYTIDDDQRVVTVVAVAHRRDAYLALLQEPW